MEEAKLTSLTDIVKDQHKNHGDKAYIYETYKAFNLGGHCFEVFEKVWLNTDRPRADAKKYCDKCKHRVVQRLEGACSTMNLTFEKAL